VEVTSIYYQTERDPTPETWRHEHQIIYIRGA